MRMETELIKRKKTFFILDGTRVLNMSVEFSNNCCKMISKHISFPQARLKRVKKSTNFCLVTNKNRHFQIRRAGGGWGGGFYPGGVKVYSIAQQKGENFCHLKLIFRLCYIFTSTDLKAMIQRLT
jgi:hypothetical protein